MIAARGRDGEVATYPLCENHHEGGILRRSLAPAAVSPKLAEQAERIAARILNGLDYVGVVGIELFESPHSFEVGGKQILLVHDIGEVAQRSLDSHAVVVHGHTHQVEMKERGSTLLINPGEACGWLYGAPTAAILDLESLSVEILKLDESRWPV